MKENVDIYKIRQRLRLYPKAFVDLRLFFDKV